MYGTCAKMLVKEENREALQKVVDSQMSGEPIPGYMRSYVLRENDSDANWLFVVFEDAPATCATRTIPPSTSASWRSGDCSKPTPSGTTARSPKADPKARNGGTVRPASVSAARGAARPRPSHGGRRGDGLRPSRPAPARVPTALGAPAARGRRPRCSRPASRSSRARRSASTSGRTTCPARARRLRARACGERRPRRGVELHARRRDGRGAAGSCERLRRRLPGDRRAAGDGRCGAAPTAAARVPAALCGTSGRGSGRATVRSTTRASGTRPRTPSTPPGSAGAPTWCAPATPPIAREDPFAIFTDAAYRGLVGFYDSYREALALGLQRDGVADLRDATDGELAAAGDFLEEAVRVAGARFTDDGVIEGLPERTFAAHQAWSGDILTAPRYAAGGGYGYGGSTGTPLAPTPRRPPPRSATGRRAAPSGSSVSISPPSRRADATRSRPTRSSTTCCSSTSPSTTSPGTATRCRWTARRARRSPTRRFPWHGAVPANLLDAIVSEEDFAAGQMLVGFGPSEDAAWRAQWSRVEPS